MYLSVLDGSSNEILFGRSLNIILVICRPLRPTVFMAADLGRDDRRAIICVHKAPTIPEIRPYDPLFPSNETFRGVNIKVKKSTSDSGI